MEEHIVYILPGIFLLLNAWYDIRKRKILLHSIGIFTVLWILFLVFVDKEKIWHGFGGILPGMFLLASAYATRQAVGYGDGLAVCVCGLYLGMWQTFAMLFYALLLCSAVSAVLLMCRRRTYKTGVPFVPYLAVGYLCTFLL